MKAENAIKKMKQGVACTVKASQYAFRCIENKLVRIDKETLSEYKLDTIRTELYFNDMIKQDLSWVRWKEPSPEMAYVIRNQLSIFDFIESEETTEVK